MTEITGQEQKKWSSSVHNENVGIANTKKKTASL